MQSADTAPVLHQHFKIYTKIFQHSLLKICSGLCIIYHISDVRGPKGPKDCPWSLEFPLHGGLLTEYDYVLDLSHITYVSLDKSPELSRLKLVHFRMGRITLALTHCQGFARSENIYKKVSTYKIVHCKM